jgi:hypothetical protein
MKFWAGRNLLSLADMATGSGWAETLVGLPAKATAGTRSLFVPPIVTTNIGTGTGAPPKMSILVSVASYVFAIAIILGILLLFVHFTIRPIFQFTPGGQGIIPVPGFKDSHVYWKKPKEVAILKETAMGTAQLPVQNWSFTLDIFIKNPTTHHASNIPVFMREELLATNSQSPKSNAHVYLVPGTNDLIVGVTNTANNQEDVVLSNVPVQTPFRVGVVIMDVAMEVYVNGRLMKTRTFDAPPGRFLGQFVPPQGAFADLVKVRNLQVWPRLASASEIRYAKPPLMSAAEFNTDKMDSASSSCMQSLEKEARADLSSLSSSTASTQVGK